MLLFVLQWLFLQWEILTCCCLSFHWLSIKFTMGCLVSLHSLWLFSYWLGWSLWSFELGASSAASEFCEWIQVGIDVYISHRKYQVKLNSSPWFSASCVAARVHRNHFFCLYQKDKSSDSKVKFRQASNHCKRVLEDAKLAYTNKTKESITSQKLGFHDFRWIANSVLNKGKSAVPPLIEVFSSASCLLKTYLRTLILMTQVSLSLFSLLELIWNCIIFLQQPRWFKRSWWILNCQRQIANCPDCIPVVDLKNYEPEVSYILAKLLNMCLKETYFLDCWKVSSVVPVFKNVMERFTAKNYQPVSLQSVVNKVFEKTCK